MPNLLTFITFICW